MGTIDANGVYIYDATDQMVPHDTYMNLGQQSVSDALGEMRSDFTYPTSTASITLHSGLGSGSATQWRKNGLGGVILSVQLGTVTSGTVIGSVGGVYRPTQTTYVPMPPNANAQAFIIISPSTGEMTLFYYGLSLPTNANNYLRGAQAWPLP